MFKFRCINSQFQFALFHRTKTVFISSTSVSAIRLLPASVVTKYYYVCLTGKQTLFDTSTKTSSHNNLNQQEIIFTLSHSRRHGFHWQSYSCRNLISTKGQFSFEQMDPSVISQITQRTVFHAAPACVEKDPTSIHAALATNITDGSHRISAKNFSSHTHTKMLFDKTEALSLMIPHKGQCLLTEKGEERAERKKPVVHFPHSCVLNVVLFWGLAM